jgi:putative oxidoreductase
MNWTTMRAWLEQRRDLWIDVLRIYLGIGLFIRGLIFFTSGDQLLFHNFAGGDAYAMLSSGFVMHYVVLAHMCGGTLLAFGLLTRLAAAVQVPVLIGAVIAHSADGVFALGQSLEFAALVLVILLFIIVAGPGRFSVDHYTFRRKITADDEHDAEHPAPVEQHH